MIRSLWLVAWIQVDSDTWIWYGIVMDSWSSYLMNMGSNGWYWGWWPWEIENSWNCDMLHAFASVATAPSCGVVASRLGMVRMWILMGSTETTLKIHFTMVVQDSMINELAPIGCRQGQLACRDSHGFQRLPAALCSHRIWDSNMWEHMERELTHSEQPSSTVVSQSWLTMSSRCWPERLTIAHWSVWCFGILSYLMVF